MRSPVMMMMMAAAVLTLSLAACRGPASPSTSTPAPAFPAPSAPSPSGAPAAAAPRPAPAATMGKVAVSVTDEGFVPNRIPARQGQPITLAITRKTDRTCARDLMFQGQDGKTPLPLGKTVEVTYTPRTTGEIRFGCAMGMMVSGVLAVSD